jgi:hypothetical protein
MRALLAALLALWTVPLLVGCTGVLSTSDEMDASGSTSETDAWIFTGDTDASRRPDASTLPDAAIDGGFDAGVPDGVPPTADAGPDRTITWPTDRVALEGSGFDAGGPVRFVWEQRSGPSPTVFRDPSDAAPLATSLRVGVYVFRLTVTDNEGLTAFDEMTVTVQPDPRTPSTLADHLDAQTAPVFRRGHRLPPLSFGGFPHLEFNRRAAEKYRFALHIGSPTEFWADLAARYVDRPRDVIELSASDPERYAISLNMTGYDGFYDCARHARIRARFPGIAMHRMDGSVWGDPDGCYAYSPVGPAEAWVAFAQDARLPEHARTIATAARTHGTRISVFNDLGEWGIDYPVIGEWRWSDPTFQMWEVSANFWQDAAVRAAWGPLPSPDGYGRAIIERAYAGVSAGKASAQGAITRLFVDALGPDVLYTHYLAGPAPHTGRFNEWAQVAWDHARLRAGGVNHPDDVYSTQMYYGDNNEGGLGVTWRAGDPDGARPADHFTHALAAAAQAIAAGSPHGYVWISPRGRHASTWVDREEMTGFLKAYYALSMIGGPFFYEMFSYAQTDPTRTTGVVTMPGWMETIIVMGEVHALYSHLDDFLLDGHVLPNAHGDSHRFQRWIAPFPLYEQYAYPVGAELRGPNDPSPTYDPGVRVVARVNAAGDEWLVAGWAASGPTREVDVELPAPLGRTRLSFRRAGNVYRLRRSGGVTIATLVDLDPMRPTDHMLETD